jgi:hypothetical protein
VFVERARAVGWTAPVLGENELIELADRYLGQP